jgi:hypothetical protein
MIAGAIVGPSSLDINMRNVHGLTPLLAAVAHGLSFFFFCLFSNATFFFLTLDKYKGHRELIEPLVKAGADPNALVYGREREEKFSVSLF